MTETLVKFKSPLHEMTETTPTVLWNDSAAQEELKYSIEHGAVGATCNPVIVGAVLKDEFDAWKGRIAELVREMPTATEDEIAWKMVEEISVKAASLLEPIFHEQEGKNGRLSIQTDPRHYRDTTAIVEQARRFAELAPNVIVKIPVTAAGVTAIEEATYHGISINATVSFSVPQVVAVAEAVERGMERREREGKEVESIAPVCTIMVGRIDDWLKIACELENASVDPGIFEWAGVAIFKKAYEIFRERGYRIRLLSAAFRNHMHWSELIGGDVVISPPYKWQVRFNASDITVENRINDPVDPAIVSELMRFEDFRRAYDEDGMALDEFDFFPPSLRTLRGFIAGCYDLNAQVREVMLPNPDRK